MKNTGQPQLFTSIFKKASVSIITCLLLLTFVNTTLKASIDNFIPSDSVKYTALAEAKILLVRMDEINAMDKTTFGASEKKQLRKELRLIKGHLKELDKGVYVSVGALVVVLLIPLIAFNLIE